MRLSLVSFTLGAFYAAAVYGKDPIKLIEAPGKYINKRVNGSHKHHKEDKEKDAKPEISDDIPNADMSAIERALTTVSFGASNNEEAPTVTETV